MFAKAADRQLLLRSNWSRRFLFLIVRRGLLVGAGRDASGTSEGRPFRWSVTIGVGGMAKPLQRSGLDGAGASVFRHRAFAWFWVARMFSTLATQSESVTIGWQVYTLARHTRSVEQSAFLVGMVGLAQFVPNFLLALLAGATADRRDRRGIILTCTG